MFFGVVFVNDVDIVMCVSSSFDDLNDPNRVKTGPGILNNPRQLVANLPKHSVDRRWLAIVGMAVSLVLWEDWLTVKVEIDNAGWGMG